LNETIDDVSPLGDGGRFNWVAAARIAAKVTPILVPVILSVVSSLISVVLKAQAAADEARKVADRDGKATAQIVKDKAESGYQVLLHEVAELRARLALLEQPQPARRGAKPARRPLVAVAAQPRPLPASLDQAARQLGLRLVPPPAAPSPDAAP